VLNDKEKILGLVKKLGLIMGRYSPEENKVVPEFLPKAAVLRS